MSGLPGKPHGVVFHIPGKNNKQNRRKNANRKALKKKWKADAKIASAKNPELTEAKIETSEIVDGNISPASFIPETSIEDDKRKIKQKERKLKQKAKKRGEEFVKSSNDEASAVTETKTETIGGMTLGKRDRWQKEGVVSDRALYDIAEFEQVQAKTAELVAANEMTPSEAKMMLTKWKNRESRRLARIQHKEESRVCLLCRRRGHLLADCKQGRAQTGDELVERVGAGICYKCGSIEHGVRQCHVKVKGYPHAHCFICSAIGHLSRDCPTNDRGIYPDGGACKMCGENTHLRRDCPKLMPDEAVAAARKAVDIERHRVRTTGVLDVMGNAEDEHVDAPVMSRAKKAKIVRMK